MVLLNLYRTQAIVSPAWPEQTVTESSISDEQSRSALFAELLKKSSNLPQYRSLGKLLTIWPKLENRYNSEYQCAFFSAKSDALKTDSEQ